MNRDQRIDALVAFTLESAEAQQKMLGDLFGKEVMALASGPTSIRFRLPLVITAEEVDELLGRVHACLPTGVGA